MILQRNIAPPVFSPQEFTYHLSQIETEHLDNQIPLYSLLDTIEPVVNFQMVFEAGIWYEQKNAIAQTVAGLFKSGTTNLNSFQINDTIEQYGASVQVNCNTDLATISVSCLTKHFSKLLPIVFSLITDTQFYQNELDIFIQNAKQRLSVQLLKTDFVANRKIDEFMFGFQHPYGKYYHASDYDQITSEDLKSYLKKQYHFSNCKMFLAGMFSEDDKKQIHQIFGSSNWNSNPTPYQPTHTLSPAQQKQIRIKHENPSVQGSVRLSSMFVEKTHPDFVPMVILNTLFGGFFGSRLMSNIREEKGYTYGIHSMILSQRHASALLISTEAGIDVCELAIKEVYKEMEILQNELVSIEELDLVKNYLLGSILAEINGTFQIMQRWKGLILNGFDENRFYSNIEIYKSITPETIQNLAKKYFQKDAFYELVVS
ncbi:MAG TPA: pitrilysin family protein [Chitinophagaceae bacterium]|nr:pitrilysin family protein [Chitinophagaceae bacterium]